MSFILIQITLASLKVVFDSVVSGVLIRVSVHLVMDRGLFVVVDCFLIVALVLEMRLTVVGASVMLLLEVRNIVMRDLVMRSLMTVIVL